MGTRRVTAGRGLVAPTGPVQTRVTESLAALVGPAWYSGRIRPRLSFLIAE